MRRPVALMLALAALAPAQEAPRAQPVDPALRRDSQQDWFQHGRNVYESAKRSSGIRQFDLYQRSIEILTRYIGEYPNHANTEAAWWYLGQSYYAIGRVEDAKRCFHSLLNRFGRGRYAAAAAYTLGADHFNNRRYALAATLFEKLASIAEKPEDRQRGLYYAGKSFQLLGRNDRAIQNFRKLAENTDPTNLYLSKARTALGSLYARSGEPEKRREAMTLLEAVVNSNSPAEVRGEAALEAGAVAAKLGDAERSDKFFNYVLTTPGMEDFRADAQIALMAARFEQKRYREVVQFFVRSGSRASGEKEARRLMLAARAYMMLERNADALPLFRQIERLVPPQSDLAFDATYYRLLCFYRIEGRYVLDQVESFLELYRKPRPRDPKIHTALLMKAETLYADKKVIDAADVYRDIDPALLSEANRPGFLYQRGRCLADAGDPEGAIRSLSDFIKKHPSDERVALALAARGREHAETGNNGAALADFNRLLEETRDPKLLAIAYLQSAEMSKEQGDLETMVARYLDFLEQVPDATSKATAKASYWAGWGLVKLNRSGEAGEHLERARTLAPDLYKKHAGLLLCLVHLAQKEPAALGEELDEAIAEGYAADLPDQLIRWAADQAFNGGSYTQAARFYDLLADDANPELSPTEVWRFLGKARIEAGDPAGALSAIEHTLASEQDPGWRADGLTDKGRAQFNLKRYDEAMESVEAGLALRPEGRVGANLHLLWGDILMAREKPDEAIQRYIVPVQLMGENDRNVRPRALKKLIAAYEAAGKPAQARDYQRQLADQYPGWSE